MTTNALSYLRSWTPTYPFWNRPEPDCMICYNPISPKESRLVQRSHQYRNGEKKVICAVSQHIQCLQRTWATANTRSGAGACPYCFRQIDTTFNPPLINSAIATGVLAGLEVLTLHTLALMIHTPDRATLLAWMLIGAATATTIHSTAIDQREMATGNPEREARLDRMGEPSMTEAVIKTELRLALSALCGMSLYWSVKNAIYKDTFDEFVSATSSNILEIAPGLLLGLSTGAIALILAARFNCDRDIIGGTLGGLAFYIALNLIPATEGRVKLICIAALVTTLFTKACNTYPAAFRRSLRTIY